MHRRVGPRDDVPFGILVAKPALVLDITSADYGDGEAGNSGLNAQRFEILAEPAVDEVVSAQRHPDAQKQHTKSGAKGESTVGSDPGAQGLPMITDIWAVFVKSAEASHVGTGGSPNGWF